MLSDTSLWRPHEHPSNQNARLLQEYTRPFGDPWEKSKQISGFICKTTGPNTKQKRMPLNSLAYPCTVDSKKSEYGFGVIYAGFILFFCFGMRGQSYSTFWLPLYSRIAGRFSVANSTISPHYSY